MSTKKSYETNLLFSSIFEIGLIFAKAYPKFPRYLLKLSDDLPTSLELKKSPFLMTMLDFKSASEKSLISPDIEISPKVYFSPSSTSIVMDNLFLFGVIETSVDITLNFK